MATSTKQVVATVPVYDYLTPALAGKQVKVTLGYDKARSLNPVTWLENLFYSTLIDGNGFWQVNVVATDNMTPSGISYIVEVEGYITYRINPTQAGVPAMGWQSSAILIDVPGPLTTAGGTIAGPITITGGLNLTPGESGLDTNAPGALLIGDNVATSIELGVLTNAPALQALGLTGATAASRYVGATSFGAPTAGTFGVGDFVISQATGAVIVCSVAGSPGTWIYPLGIFNVKDFGAKGDGATNDASAIGLAILAAGTAGGGEVFFPPGNYLVNGESLFTYDGITIRGVKGATTITVGAGWAGGSSGTPNAVFALYSPGATVDRFTLAGISFVINNNSARAFRAFHYTRLKITDCSFTGTCTDTGGATGAGIVNLIGDNTDNYMARIQDCDFLDLPGVYAVNVFVPSTSSNKLIDSKVEGCHFERVLQRCVYVNSVSATGLIRDVKVVHNTAFDIVGGARGGSNPYAALIHAGLAQAYGVENVLVDGNEMRLSRNDERRSFAQIYSVTDVKVLNNTFIVASTTTDAGASDGQFFAPGRTSWPDIGVECRGNYVDGNYLVSVFDFDSTTDTVVADNIFRKCFSSNCQMGYGIQTRVDIHDNLFYNCVTSAGAPLLGAINLPNVTNPPSVCKIHHNIIVDDRNPAITTSALFISGGAFDFSDVDIYNNKIFLANSNLTNTVVDQGTSTRPRMYGKFEIFQASGTFYEELAQSVAVAGAGTVTPDPLLGHLLKVTYSGSFTVAAPLSPIQGRRLILQLIHDGTTGAYAITWNAIFKTNWQPPNIASAVFSLAFEYDGANWQLQGVPVDQAGNTVFSGRLISTLAGTPTASNLGANVTSVTFTGNDTRGTIAIVMSAGLAANTRVATCTFATSYGATGPKITLVDQTSTAGLAIVNSYVQAQATGVSFDLAFDQALVAGTYTIDYIVIG